ncbi:hypothetical protein [Pseudomonas sp. Fl4BN1]|uniref:hypothetical protein n=1 Tax=Pseudomonas sp. Fl4BN1 TaxID=2697651 RepID=UPI001378966F|nr:hypothetical protein [Pseudomonas sp. Fl4BN1]NBF13051.1 hypothetical protein [Pseudomonas sp. Fl4BN1]
MNNELIRLAEAAMHPLGYVTIHEELELLHQFRHACNPAEILALFAEIDRLKDDLQITNHACFLSIAEKKSLQDQLHSLLDANARLSEYPAPLRAFANELISASYEGGSFDGCDIQDIAVRHGLLRIERRESECGEVCPCREYGFPVDCYRRTSLLGPAYAQSNDAATQNADTENVSRHEVR